MAVKRMALALQHRPVASPIRLVLACVAAILGLALIAAWQIAPRLDWARYRQGIAAFAADRVGRRVTIDGPIHLALLPRPELTARDVTLADRGDGISARIAALRLTVAIGPLLRGHLVPLSLRLDDPVITAPWPLPGGAPGRVPAVAQDFAAHLDHAILHLGTVTVTSMDADLLADPDTGAFSATGTAEAAGREGRFAVFFGAPATNGAASLSLTLDGLKSLLGAAAVFHGSRAANGTLSGDLRASGPDASRLFAAPAAAWSLRGAVQASPTHVTAPSLQISLGTSPGTAGATWTLLPTPRLQATARIGQIALGDWIRGASFRAPLPVHIDLQAQAAQYSGATLRDPRVVLSLQPDRTVIESAEAKLPGGAAVHFSGIINSGQRGATLAGAAHVAAPNLPASLAWIAPSLPSGLAAMPDLPAKGEIDANVSLSPEAVRLTSLDARFGASEVRGEISLTAGPRPSLQARLSTDRLDAVYWISALPSLPYVPLPFDAALDLTALQANVPGAALTHLKLSGRADPSGMTLVQMSADVPGGHVGAAGHLAKDGAVADLRLNLDAAEAASLPADWRRMPGLWHGPLHLAVNANGPAARVSVQARCDLGDLRAEMDAALSVPDRTLDGAATLRHPGAPRLLRDAGVANAGSWLDQGSFALIAQFAARPAHLDLPAVSLSAGAARVTLQAALDLSGAIPVLQAAIDAPHLRLPGFDPRSDAPVPFQRLGNWQGQVRLTAAEVAADLLPFASDVAASLQASGGVLAATYNAAVAGGSLEGGLAIDTAAPRVAAQVRMADIDLDQIATLPPWEVSAGRVNGAIDLTASGSSPAAMLATLGGKAAGTLRGVVLQGIDLPAAAALLTARRGKMRPALLATLASGGTGPLSGDFTATLDHGALGLMAHDLQSGAGQADLAAILDLPARTEDAAMHVRPSVPAPPTLSVRLVGPWQKPKRIVDVSAGVAWAGRGKK